MQQTGSPSKRAALQSDIVIVDGWGFVSGLLPIDLHDDRAPLPEVIEAQTRKIFSNLEELLAGAGLGKDAVVSVRIALIDFTRLYERMNAAYAGFFPAGRLPARSCAGVSELPRGASVQMDFVLHAAARNA
jgi:enamine deaminase RidA (YjgF/YER057c/UK114 family)